MGQTEQNAAITVNDQIVKTSEWLQSHEYAASLGRQIPLALVSTLRDAGINTLVNYLKDNGAPEEVLDLLNHIQYFMLCEGNMRAGQLGEWDAEMLIESIGPIAKEIDALGGSVSDSELILPNPHPVKWGKK